MFFNKESKNIPTLVWEELGGEKSPTRIYRTKIPGGWLIANWDVQGSGTTFVPDPNHQWDGNSVGYQRESQAQSVQYYCVKCHAPTFNQVNGQYKCGWCE